VLTLCLPLLVSFTAISDHPRAGEVSPGCVLQAGGGGGGVGGSLVGLAFSLFLSGLMAQHRSRTHLQNTGRGKFPPRESEVRTDGTRHLAGFPDPGSIRVKSSRYPRKEKTGCLTETSQMHLKTSSSWMTGFTSWSLIVS
jgi:hypothetical protein